MIALVRAVETTILTSLAAAILLVAPQVYGALSSPAKFAAFDWRGVAAAVMIGTLAGCFNSLTAFLSSLSKQQNVMQAAFTQAMTEQAINAAKVAPAPPVQEVAPAPALPPEVLQVQTTTAPVTAAQGGP